MGKVVAGLAAVCHRRALAIIIVSLAFLSSCPLLLGGLRLDTDSARLMPSADPVATAYREGRAYHGEANPLVIQLLFPGVAPSAVDAFTDRLVETLEAEADILVVESGAARLLAGEDAPWRLRAALLNSQPPLVEELGSRLDEKGLSQALRRARKRLFTAEDLQLRKLISTDILDLTRLIAPFYQRRSAFVSAGADPRYIDSADGRSRLLVVQPGGSSEDAAYCRDLLSRIESRAEGLRGELGGTGAVELRFTGVHAMTAESAHILMGDMVIITAVATALLFSLLWLSFGRLRVALICFYPLLVSLGAVLVLARAFFNPINYLTIGFAAIVMGLALDVGLHLMARYFHFARGTKHREALRLTFEDGGPPVIIGIASTAAAFLALLFSNNPGLSQFGQLTAAGLVLSLIITLTVFPAALRYLAPRDSGATQGLRTWWIPGRLLRVGGRRPLLSLAAALILIIGGLGLGRDFNFDMDVENLMPRDLQAMELADEIADAYGLSFASLIQVSIQAPGSDDALEAQRRLDQELEALVGEGQVAGFRSASELFVYPLAEQQTAKSRAAALAALQQERGTFFQLLEELRFRPSPHYHAYLDLLEQVLGDAPPSLPTDSSRFAAQAGELYRLQTAVWPAVAKRQENTEATESVDRRIAHLPMPPGVRIKTSGIRLVYERMNDKLRQAFLDVSWIAGLLVAGLVMVFFRSPMKTVLSLLPFAAAVPVTIGFIVAGGLSFTPLAMAFGAVIVGIGIDDAVHILARCPKGSAESVAAVVEEIGPVITLTTLSTVIGFGSLSLSRLPVVSSLGLVIAVGVLACLVFAVLLIPALLTLLSRGGLWSAGAAGALLLCFPLGAGAQDESAEAILARLEERLEKTEAASCSFDQTKHISQIVGEIHCQGTLLVQKPHFFKMSLTGDENLAVYCNGRSVWIVDRDLEEVTELPFDAATAGDLGRLLPSLLFSDLSDVKAHFTVSYAGQDQGLHLLRFEPVHADTSPLRSMVLGLDGRDRLRRSSVEYVNGDRVETTYRDWRTLGRVSPHAFVFYGSGEAPGELQEEDKNGVKE